MVTTKPQSANSLVLEIDFQEKLIPAMSDPTGPVSAACKLISAADILQVPVIATEQYPAGLGGTCQSIRALLNERKPHEKMLFSAFVPSVQSALASLQRRQIIIVGIETHVCIQQTVLDLLRQDFQVWVCADATCSRRTQDYIIALERMRQAGTVISTTESVIFELLGQAGTDQFKKILRIIK